MRRRTDFTALSHFCRRILGAWSSGVDGGGTDMKRQIAIVAMAMMVSSAAVAGERSTSAALGAVSGAVVLGPIGAVAGAFIGYTAGPSMARAWGVRGGNSSARQPRRTASNDGRPYHESQAAMRAPAAAPAAAAPAQKTASKSPPVQPLE